MPTSSLSLSQKDLKRMLSRLAKTVMQSHKVRIPKYDMPIRLRPWFLVLTCLIMVLLAFLGFTNFSRALPLNDKILHFMCFCIATGVFYFIVDVDESARRIWFWRQSGLLFTVFICVFCGGILSEFVQAALPFKQFEWGDVLANLLGSSLGLWVSYNLERYHRHRREIARLYRPLSATVSEYEEDEDDDDSGMSLLPTHTTNFAGPNQTNKKKSRLADVWDEREEVFDIGVDSDDENTHEAGSSHPEPQQPQQPSPPQPQTPRIVITHS